MTAVDEDKGGLFFLYGYGGTGKTFIWRILYFGIRSRGDIVLTITSSRIASFFLLGGRTTHSRFAIPLNPTEDSTCNIKKGNPLAKVIIKTKLIIWDEAPMMHRYCFEAFDQTLRDILRFEDTSNVDQPFGGVPVMLLKNIDQSSRLYNGTRLVIIRLETLVIEAKANYILLAITSANQDIATSDAIKIAREVDPTSLYFETVYWEQKLSAKLYHVGFHDDESLNQLNSVIKARIPAILSLISISIDELEAKMGYLGKPVAIDTSVLPMSRRAGQNKSKFFELTGCEMLRSILRVHSCSAEAIDVSKCSIQWYRLSSECRRREPIIARLDSSDTITNGNPDTKKQEGNGWPGMMSIRVHELDGMQILNRSILVKVILINQSRCGIRIEAAFALASTTSVVLLLLAAAAIFTAQCTLGVSKSGMQPVRSITTMPKISLSIFTSQCTLGESKEWNATYEKHSSYAKLLKVCILGNLPDDGSIAQIIKLNYGHHQG
ncbi:hypothetical protein BC332_30598 [Capsicum chinense]|nr:hypothetical protein BC332_30598 [Capsicum chinense]